MTLEKLLDKLVKSTVYSEPPSLHHHGLIEKVWAEVVKPALPGGSLSILDVGAGDGFAMELFERAGHRATGVNYTNEDRLACLEKNLCCVQGDMHELSFWEDDFDLVWARHVLEHSPFPMRALCEIHKVLKPGGLFYVEVPAPGTACEHESNPNHFSVFTQKAWGWLLTKAGFDMLAERSLTFRVDAGEDTYFLWLCRKPL